MMNTSAVLRSNLLRNFAKQLHCSAHSKGWPIRCISTSPLKNNSFKVQDVKDFEERVMNSKDPVIVDFFATWCNPCKMLAPRLESVLAEKKAEVILAKVDIDENTDLALDFDIHTVPVILGIKNGKLEERLVGLKDTEELRKFVDKLVSAKK